MASCDDDFGLLGDEVNQHHNHHHHHNQIDQQQQHQLSSFSPFSSSHHHNQQHHHHRYIPAKGGTNGGVSVQSHPFLAGNNININHDNQCSESTAFAPQSDNHHRFTTTAEVDDDEDEDDDSAFAPQSPESPQNVDDEEDDRNNYCNTVANDASEHPVISSSKSHGGGGGLGQLGIGIVSTPPPPPSRHNNHHQFGRISSSSSSRQHPVVTDLDPHLKRKDLQHHNQREDHLSDGAESPSSNYYSKKSRTTTTTANNVIVTTNAAAAAAATTSSSMDCRKDREEWSDSAIACLLDAYTDKYLQLNKGNLRGRDWEDVATIVSKRSEKHKSGKSVEQCKNKVDNLKKRYKVECQRLSSGSLAVSHWPWFKKMEQIVGSSSSSSKAATDDDKPSPLAASVTATSRQLKKYQVASPTSASLANNFRMRSASNPRWKRALLKISGVSLVGIGPHNVDPKVILLIAREVAVASRIGVEVAIVVGGRNFFCGDTWVAATDTDRAAAYQIGMMASAMNALLLQASLEKIGIETRVQTAFMMQEIAEPYIRRKAIRHLEKGRVVIFSASDAGNGNPLLTTDTAAALRASEINADVLLKGTDMDHVYECHSGSNSAGFEHVSFKELDSRSFSAMDMTAITFCAENNIPVILFNLMEPGNISRALCGDQVGTLIDQSGRIS